MAEIRPFVLIQDWMFDLGLNPSEVIAVAVIYGFTQDGQHTCHASLPYLERRCCIDRRNVVKLLSRLELSGILKVVRYPGRKNEYSLDLEVVTKRHGCQNITRDEKAQSSDVSSPLSPTPPIPIRKDNKITRESACAPAHTHTCEGVEEVEGSGKIEGDPTVKAADAATDGSLPSSEQKKTTPEPPGPPCPSVADDSGSDAGLFHVSSMERESVGFDKDRIAGLKRARMAESLERVAANLAAKDGLEMSEGQKARFLDYWCAHRPGSDRVRAEDDPYFSLYAKARGWVRRDTERAEGSAGVFTPPTLDEVRAFFQEAAPDMDPLEFYGYYKARGWTFPGGVRMSDWKSAVYLWISRERKRR